MATDSVTLRLEGEVEVAQLSRELTRFSAVLEELPKSRQASVRWLVSGLEHGSAITTARAIPLDARSEPLVPQLIGDLIEVANDVTRGVADDGRPLLRLVRDLTQDADEHHPIILETETDEVIFTDADTDAAAPPADLKTRSIGVVRGRVETLSHRGQLRFTLFDLVNDRAVSCYLSEEQEDLMRDAWGHIADVTGTVTRDGPTGRPLAVRRVTSVERVRDGDPMGFLNAEGAVAPREPAEEVIRRVRDAV